jgi:hypothetical protein
MIITFFAFLLTCADDDIRRYLPDLSDFGAPITVRHLLYHTSGIRDWRGLVKLSGRHLDDVITDDFLMKPVMNQKELNFKPGESFQYSNTGYFLLARIISNVTGISFREMRLFTKMRLVRRISKTTFPTRLQPGSRSLRSQNSLQRCSCFNSFKKKS